MWLLKDKSRCSGELPDVFRVNALFRTGYLANNCFNKQVKCGVLPDIDDEIRELWYEALSAEAMLVPPEYRERYPFDTIPVDVTPFGEDGPRYGELKGCRAATVLFPLDGETPQLGRVWAVKGVLEGKFSNLIYKLVGASELVDQVNRDGIILVPELPKGCRVEGRSWQLAACLAIRALKSQDVGVTLSLARKYIATGAIRGKDIEPVKIGNKLAIIKTVPAIKREWLLERGNKKVFWDTENQRVEVPFSAVRTIEDAWYTVAGYGTRPSEEKVWPESIKVMHILVGGSIVTALAALLYTVPKKIYLWHSSNPDKSIRPAKEIERLLKKYLRDRMPEVFEYEMPSNSVVRAEEELDKVVATYDESEPVYFNVTSGNRMMMLATDRWAVGKKNVRMIYRDFDDGDHLGYVCVWHDDDSAYTCMLKPGFDGKKKEVLMALLKPGLKAEDIDRVFEVAVKTVLGEDH